MQAVNQLEIKKIRIECNGESESVDDGDKVEDLKPDTECAFEVDVENNFDDNDDEYDDGTEMKTGEIDFDDVTVSVESDDLDIDEDPDTEVSSDTTETVDGKFSIEDDADDGTYTVTVRVVGKDDNDAMHGEEWTFRLEVNRLSHDVQIRSPAISPTTVSACDGGTIRIVSRISNVGTRDEDEVAVELSVPDLKFTKRTSDIELDSDDSTSVSFVIDVPAGAKSGVYRATLSTFFDNTAPSNSQTLEFAVEKCDTAEVVVVPTQQQNATVQPQTGTQTTTPTSGAVAVPRARVTSSSSFTSSAGYLWMLGGLGVVLLIIIIILLMVAFRKPRTDVL
jgi:hypothetical protein